jgi:predicted dehydrogenase
MGTGNSRRDFLRKTAAAAAAAGFASSASAGEEVFADERPVEQARARAALAGDQPVRIGVIGTGGMGTAHCEALTRLAAAGRVNVRVDALCDVCVPRLENAKKLVDAAQGSDTAAYGDYKQLLARPDLHGVLIASPEHWHGRMSEDAIEAGKDVYVEKPMTLNLKDALRLQKVVHANPDMILVVGTQFVMTPSYQVAGELIAKGAIGKPVWSQTSYCRNSKEGEWNYYEIDPNWKPGENVDWKKWCGPLGKADWSPEIFARWRRYRKYSTGIIGDLLVHHMTPLIRALDVGWPVRVSASGGHYIDKKMENHDQVNLTVEFEREHTMIVAGSTCNELGVERVIRGHKGNLYVGGRNAVLRPERIYADEVDEQEIAAPPGAGANDQDELRVSWVESIRSRQKHPSDVDLGTKVMVIVDLATRSLWEGSAYEYDPARRKVKRA